MRILISFILIAMVYGFSPKKPSQFKDDSTYSYRKIENKAFRAGEKTKYLVHYGMIDAGYANLEIKAGKKVHNRDMLHIIGTGVSQGMVDFFFHVDDRYESIVDKESIFPWLFVRDIQEGGYKLQQEYKFYQHERKVQTQKGAVHDVPLNVQDMLSSAFYARTLNLNNLKKGQIITVKSFVDDENFNLKIKYAGRETIKIQSGTYRCLKFHPVIQEGRVFKAEEDMEVWISDDANKIPILCKAKILVGSVKVELADYSGLANPLAKE